MKLSSPRRWVQTIFPIGFALSLKELQRIISESISVWAPQRVIEKTMQRHWQMEAMHEMFPVLSSNKIQGTKVNYFLFCTSRELYLLLRSIVHRLSFCLDSLIHGWSVTSFCPFVGKTISQVFFKLYLLRSYDLNIKYRITDGITMKAKQRSGSALVPSVVRYHRTSSITYCQSQFVARSSPSKSTWPYPSS